MLNGHWFRGIGLDRSREKRGVQTRRFFVDQAVQFRLGGLDFFQSLPKLHREEPFRSSKIDGAPRMRASDTTNCSIGEFDMHRFDFTPYRRTTVGFDRLFDMLENAKQAGQSDNYPPFNIERTAENHYLVTIAVAGFKPDEIDITAQQNMLVVAGKKDVDGNDNRDFLHLGIANRNFERRFQLADHVFVKGADLADGLLTVQLERQVPDELKPRKIVVGGSTPTVIEHDEGKKKGKAA
jgi:molecular chaperone IbpA